MFVCLLVCLGPEIIIIIMINNTVCLWYYIIVMFVYVCVCVQEGELCAYINVCVFVCVYRKVRCAWYGINTPSSTTVVRVRPAHPSTPSPTPTSTHSSHSPKSHSPFNYGPETLARTTAGTPPPPQATPPPLPAPRVMLV